MIICLKMGDKIPKGAIYLKTEVKNGKYKHYFLIKPNGHHPSYNRQSRIRKKDCFVVGKERS